MTPWHLSRRAFLGRSLAISAGLALDGVLLAGCRGSYQGDLPADLRLQTLKPWEFVVLRAGVARILDGAGEGPSAEDVARRADAELATVDDPAVRAGIGHLLLFLEYGTPLVGYFRPFSVLAADEQDRVLAGLARSRFRTGRVTFATVKLFAYYYHYAAPVTWPALGYDGPWVGRLPLPAYAVDYGTRNGAPFTSGSRPLPTDKA
jgi:hypothetical protein